MNIIGLGFITASCVAKTLWNFPSTSPTQEQQKFIFFILLPSTFLRNKMECSGRWSPGNEYLSAGCSPSHVVFHRGVRRSSLCVCSFQPPTLDEDQIVFLTSYNQPSYDVVAFIAQWSEWSALTQSLWIGNNSMFSCDAWKGLVYFSRESNAVITLVTHFYAGMISIISYLGCDTLTFRYIRVPIYLRIKWSQKGFSMCPPTHVPASQNGIREDAQIFRSSSHCAWLRSIVFQHIQMRITRTKQTEIAS